ncbi:MAG: hypothetical protein GQ529_04800 [Methyloprofundus sp.]|nr:hypothetical protein [Methyloprofundus sp.]
MTIKLNKRIFKLIICFTALLLFTHNSLAETETVEITEQEHAILNQLKQGEDSVSEPVVTGDETYIGLFSSKLGAANLNLSTLRGLELTWDDSDFSLRVGGRIYLDLAFYIEDQNDLGDDGLGLRTLQIDMSGKLNKSWFYRLKWGGFTSGGKLDSSGAYLNDAYIRYLGFDNMIVTLGQHTEPFSLEEQTSSLNTTFMERALPSAFAPGSTIGLSAAFGGENWFASGGFFTKQLSNYKDQGDQGYGFTGYLSTSPFRNEKGVIHIGGSLSYRFGNKNNDVFFRYRPESGLTSVRYANTGTIAGAKDIGRIGFDIAGIFGAWSFQSEYIHTLVGRDSGYKDVDFNGWYAFVSWFATGEGRNYRQNGVFGSTTPIHSYGAWEMAFRYSNIDLNDADIYGGEEHNITLGLNWYIHQQLRIMFNYSYVMTDENANDNGTVIGNDYPHIIQMRLQANF